MGKRLLFLDILLIASLGMSTTVVRSELTCGKLREECMAMCIPGGTSWCMQCCQARGYVHGRCSSLHGEVTCYCCKDVPSPPSPAHSP
ncbi:hypothetical protein ZWY2020_054328 [Hordeum vulgare]|nr:hypothetical protein ZWY2020_054328 [Hordeum vulgare]